MNKNPQQIFTSNRESILGIRLSAPADYGCAPVRDLHTIHPLSGKYRLFYGKVSLNSVLGI